MNGERTGGSSGYKGYDYQIVVTVWLALKLMLEKRSCTTIEIEPASNEDIEADYRAGKEHFDRRAVEFAISR